MEDYECKYCGCNLEQDELSFSHKYEIDLSGDEENNLVSCDTIMARGTCSKCGSPNVHSHYFAEELSLEEYSEHKQTIYGGDPEYFLRTR